MLNKEKWKWVIGYRGYYKISTIGRVKSVCRGVNCNGGIHVLKSRILKPYFSSNGYPTVDLQKKGKQKTIEVHRLVLETFIGPCPEGMECRHYPDQTKTNNRLENLSWDYYKININDKVEAGNDPSGERNGNAKLTWKKVRKIRKLYKTGDYTMQAIANRFGMSKAPIVRVITNKGWIND